YGKIHTVLRQLVLDQYGKEIWEEVRAKAQCQEGVHFMVFKAYDDQILWNLIQAICDVLDVQWNHVCNSFGEYFVEFCLENGYGDMLHTLGEDFYHFVNNLDALHRMLSMTYTDMKTPSFRLDIKSSTFRSEVKKGRLILHYYTTRVGKQLQHLVIGLLRAVGKMLFNVTVMTTLLETTNELISLTSEELIEHNVFEIEILENDAKIDNLRNSTSSAVNVRGLECNLVGVSDFCQILPYHIVFDENLEIKQYGKNVAKILPFGSEQSIRLDDLFQLKHPKMPLTMTHLKSQINATFFLEPKVTNLNHRSHIALRGQMSWLESTDLMVFLASPKILSIDEMREKRLFISDIPLYDVTRDLILINQQRSAEREVSKHLDEATAQLKLLAHELEAEKRKTNALLYEMLPRKVADQLREGKKVEAEKFSEVTILFSDIVSFTDIAAGSHPMEVLQMLNCLYSKFDHLTSIHDVYKVETIGDAYMVVAGIQREGETSIKVANMALAMMQECHTVSSPVTGKPLQIRIGFHTGPVVAGVVGDKMPRYCLFGDSVNTASRMESNSLPGHIHISPQSHQVLSDSCKSCKFKSRGMINIKGKGDMETFFLLGIGDTSIESNMDYIENNVDVELKVKSATTEEENGDVKSNSKNNLRIIQDVRDVTASGHGGEVVKQQESRLCCIV
ncbi:unnamed protein product, partial [Owenia fusiformis]